MVGDDPERVRQLGGGRRVACRRSSVATSVAGPTATVVSSPAWWNVVVAGSMTTSRSDASMATAPSTAESRRQLIGDPATDGIVTAGEMPGVVGVQALDALARPADPARWRRPARCDVLVALGGVPPVGVGQGHGIHFRLGSPHATGGLQTAHGLHLAPPDQPVPRRHGRAVIEAWCVADDDRRTCFVPDHDLERAGRLAAEQLSHRRSIDLVGDHRPKYR